MPSQRPTSVEENPAVPASDGGFAAWFSDSLAVNPDGTPLTVYHGTAHNVRVFKPAQAHDGIYFTDNAETADEYAEIATNDAENTGAVVYPVHLSIRRPLEISNDDLMFTEETQELLETTIAQARREGRDGVILRAVDDHGACCSSDMYVVFESNQVRSALGHRALFAPEVTPEVAPANPSNPFDRSLPVRGLEMKNATVRLGDLPRDMREELFNEHATNLNPDATERGFYAKRVPSGTIAIADLIIDRIPVEQLERYTDPAHLPPIVISDGRLIDGQHRIARGRSDGVERLRFIDVTGLIDTDAGGFVSELPRVPKSPALVPLADAGAPLTLFHGSPHVSNPQLPLDDIAKASEALLFVSSLDACKAPRP